MAGMRCGVLVDLRSQISSSFANAFRTASTVAGGYGGQDGGQESQISKNTLRLDSGLEMFVAN